MPAWGSVLKGSRLGRSPTTVNSGTMRSIEGCRWWCTLTRTSVKPSRPSAETMNWGVNCHQVST